MFCDKIKYHTFGRKKKKMLSEAMSKADMEYTCSKKVDYSIRVCSMAMRASLDPHCSLSFMLASIFRHLPETACHLAFYSNYVNLQNFAKLSQDFLS